jgi:hypothetical protein
MGKINWARVLLGGFIAGFVINVFFLGPSLGALHLSLSWAREQTVAVAILLFALVFIVTILVTWFYAAAGLRFGTGLRTAALVSLISGLLVVFFQYIGWIMTSRLIPGNVWATDAGIAFVAVVIATLLGAWVYEKPSS